MASDTVETIRQAVVSVAEQPHSGVQAVLLIGSYARREECPGTTDVDLIILLSEQRPWSSKPLARGTRAARAEARRGPRHRVAGYQSGVAGRCLGQDTDPAVSQRWPNPLPR